MKTLFAMLFIFSTFSAFSQVEGRVASFTVKLNSASVDIDGTYANGSIENVSLDSGLFFQPKSRNVHMQVPAQCSSLFMAAITRDLNFTVTGKVQQFVENLVKVNELSFDSIDVNCSIVLKK